MKNSTLRILNNSAPLIGQNQFNQSLMDNFTEPNQAPRALRSLSQIIDGGLCHRCGSCIGICPTKVLKLDKSDYPMVENLSACTDCELCVKVCPGDEFHYEELFKEKFNKQPDFKFTHGHFDEALIAYSNDEEIRSLSTSGGLVTGILVHLLETKQIDGALVIASDPDIIWKGKPIIARTRSEILSAMKSKYAISPSNSVFSEIREMPGKYAIVGLPCQVHGYVKAAKLDERLRERIVLSIGLFCHAAIEHEAFETIWDGLGEKTKGARKFISRVGKHTGAPHLQYEDGTHYPVYFGDKQGYRPSSMEMINILYRLYTPSRCLTCFDGLSEFADISIGDPWIAPPEDHIKMEDGWSFCLSRTERGKAILADCISNDKITIQKLTESEALKCNHQMATEKRWRAYRVIETHKRQGKSVPHYGKHDMDFPAHSGKQFIETEANMLSHIFCFLPKFRRNVLKFFLYGGGYWLLWLNNKRRRFKLFYRDSKSSIRRKIFGRQ